MIVYRESTDGVLPVYLAGFFVGWPNPPSPETHLCLLEHSDAIVLAIDEASARVVGYITAITDHVLTAYIAQLEVLPEYQGRGIGRNLVERMVERLREIYAIDLLCDDDVVPFYSRLGFQRAGGMIRRNYENQAGAEDPVLVRDRPG